jgi:chromosomal replication initiation ATPase DnaA
MNINYVLSKMSANEKDAIIGVIFKTYRSIQSSLDKISDVMKSDLVADGIVDLVCAEFSTDKEAVYSERRHKHLNEARTLIMYFLRVDLDWKFQDIGYKLNRDHSTVVAGVKRAKDWLKYDKVFIQKYKNVKKNMQNT